MSTSTFSMTTSNLPSNQLQFSDSRFNACTALGQISLPASIQDMEANAFADADTSMDEYLEFFEPSSSRTRRTQNTR